MAQSRYITVLFVPDGNRPQRGFRVRTWVVQAGGVALTMALLAIIIFFATYSKIMVRATMTDRLKEENEQLLKYQYKVRILEDNIAEMRQVVARLTSLAGIDYQFPEIPSDSELFAAIDEAPAAAINRPATDFTMPAGLPIRGFITQNFEVKNDARYHSGVDIACPVGTPVLATAAGLVIFADVDSTYGNMIVLRHNDTVVSVYGHLDRILARAGEEVPAGSRIGLSGNTGISTAPHLHYEVRINDEPINPLENPYDQEKRQ
ncbi:MAG TPA: M23 family metallopeptidase [candidate division Zixibacteria bacterium]|nr:M23 family metallopeptidase [candidate division Zixibacteria bacterium]MDD4917304.1 M23 family metallopeptidase [candidate division Zixibacteria bacterium]MDM7971548.1 M23 family metallopeptidase [candidate division Zixibacteria bacterium]HOD65458.1 M23 family metallopeptidase [candidate division Zixibacteria bacterium]HPI33270.1 M23 family metallopeptidase [candidate division Zixibacteria bacterium]